MRFAGITRNSGFPESRGGLRDHGVVQDSGFQGLPGTVGSRSHLEFEVPEVNGTPVFWSHPKIRFQESTGTPGSRSHPERLFTVVNRNGRVPGHNRNSAFQE